MCLGSSPASASLASQEKLHPMRKPTVSEVHSAVTSETSSARTPSRHTRYLGEHNGIEHKAVLYQLTVFNSNTLLTQFKNVWNKRSKEKPSKDESNNQNRGDRAENKEQCKHTPYSSVLLGNVCSEVRHFVDDVARACVSWICGGEQRATPRVAKRKGQEVIGVRFGHCH